MDDAASNKFIPRIKLKHRIDKSYSWRRFLARLIDYQISALILSGLILYTELLPDSIIDALVDSKMAVAAWGFFSTVQWVILESLLLTMFKTTPGKVLLGLRLTSQASEPNYWLRSLAVWVVGAGFGLSFISLFAGLIAANRMKRQGTADWDRWTGFKVETEPLRFTGGAVVAVLIALIIGNREVFIVTSSHPKLTVTKIQNEIRNADINKLAEHPAFVDTYQNETDKTYDVGARLYLAREVLAKKAGDRDFANSLVKTGLLSIIHGENKRIELTAEEEFATLKTKAEAGDANAQSQVGYIYDTGDDRAHVSPDKIKAAEWYLKAAYQGHAGAQYWLGDKYAKGIMGMVKDESKAVELYKKSAEQDYADAQYELAVRYDLGKTVPKDSVKAAELYQKAEESFQKQAAQGDALGKYAIGVRYAKGIRGPKDAIKAVEWLEKAAAEGFVHAEYVLGEMYDKGIDLPRNTEKAIQWYEKAADHGDEYAQFVLAFRHYSGEGLPKDLVKAVEWYQKSAAQGNIGAQFNLGVMYDEGAGVPKSAIKAAEWYLKAAAQGNADAQYNLGLTYYNGQAGIKDSARAYAWVNLAAAQGHSEAQQFRDKLDKPVYSDYFSPPKMLISDVERQEGQRLTSNWKQGDTLLATNEKSSSEPSRKPMKQGTGSAFVISSEGHALTNYHVIKDCKEVKTLGLEGISKVINADTVNDLALLQLPVISNEVASLNPNPGKLRQGEDIIVFGYPLNFALSSGGNLTLGTISALTGLGNNTNQIQITAPIQPGSSGSPVMDKKGYVVAVVSMKLDDAEMAKATGQVGQNVNFAVNGQTVRAFLDANKVRYKTGGGLLSFEKSNADIAEEARKWTVLVECWR
ncbi:MULTISPECIES: trypsin-like peptidase domain-containing protein [Methylomonas]|uniref:RDD domain-containing protein n=2 Tax=Methylomonas TaxID=416 RepID=A0A140E674_9GAMM|nr:MULTISPECIES: trypsin-like peptidase domain-containing protein [Methylomonas]AMK78898.1 hypothetical protein JT25_020825 [Methylomonas denitrificans]OAI02169.1 hypothetical protein A1342_02755 [Methylomonas methanica]TCV78238.1 TPR repeat protein [Methylomonas methanica]